MNEDVKLKIYRLIDSIEDEAVLQIVAEDIQYYTGNKDIIDDLDQEQQRELDNAVSEADNGETLSWDDFKKEMNEWKKR